MHKLHPTRVNLRTVCVSSAKFYNDPKVKGAALLMKPCALFFSHPP
jgi:hypothetical protein